jgi:hypothetical protein
VPSVEEVVYVVDDDPRVGEALSSLIRANGKRVESALQMRERQLLGIIETIPSMLWSVSFLERLSVGAIVGPSQHAN